MTETEALPLRCAEHDADLVPTVRPLAYDLSLRCPHCGLGIRFCSRCGGRDTPKPGRAVGEVSWITGHCSSCFDAHRREVDEEAMAVEMCALRSAQASAWDEGASAMAKVFGPPFIDISNRNPYKEES